jgi:hypothetical protein
VFFQVVILNLRDRIQSYRNRFSNLSFRLRLKLCVCWIEFLFFCCFQFQTNATINYAVVAPQFSSEGIPSSEGQFVFTETPSTDYSKSHIHQSGDAPACKMAGPQVRSHVFNLHFVCKV